MAQVWGAAIGILLNLAAAGKIKKHLPAVWPKAHGGVASNLSSMAFTFVKRSSQFSRKNKGGMDPKSSLSKGKV